MFEVVYMKADFEPWWMFEGWEEEILSRQTFESEDEAKKCLNEMVMKLRKQFHHENEKQNCFFAFWSEEERNYCEACSEDLQIFHGVILLCEGKPFVINK